METSHFVKINLLQSYFEYFDSSHCMLRSVNILDYEILGCGGASPCVEPLVSFGVSGFRFLDTVVTRGVSPWVL